MSERSRNAGSDTKPGESTAPDAARPPWGPRAGINAPADWPAAPDTKGRLAADCAASRSNSSLRPAKPTIQSPPPLRLNIARNGRMSEKNRMTLPNPQALNMTPWRERPRRLGKGRARGFAGRSAVMPSRSMARIQDAPIGLSAHRGHARKTPLNRSKGRGASRRARQTRFCLFRMRGRSRLLRRV